MRTDLNKLGINKSRLRLLLGLFFLSLAIPMAILIYQAFSQMKWEAFRQHQVLAEELASRIGNHVDQFIQSEEDRSFSEYSFLNVIGDARTNVLQRSPLASFPVPSNVPGVIGYFQIDDQGEFSTPLLPTTDAQKSYGIPEEEHQQRLALRQQIQQILSNNRLVKEARPSRPLALREQSKDDSALAGGAASRSTMETEMVPLAEDDSYVSVQATFDELKSLETAKRKTESEERRAVTLGRVEELQLRSQFDDKPAMAPQKKSTPSELEQKRAIRKEQAILPEPLVSATSASSFSDIQFSVRITTFESEIDPFDFSLLDSGHFVLFRKVWRDGERYTQGLLLDQTSFLHGVVESTFRETQLSQMSNLAVAYQDEVVSVFSGPLHSVTYLRAAQLRGDLLYQARLSAPLSDIQLIFSITQLPNGPGATVIMWAALVLAVVLCSGFYLVYGAGVRQLELAQQQQDFVSAVSHELKTPLTSIRMYGEILRQGWADEAKKKTYYDYIHDESERLTRLINNVLQLARMTRNEIQLNIKPVAVGELVDIIRSKVSSQLEHSGFNWDLQCDMNDGDYVLQVDPDAFSQIFINLVDNAIKFSAKAETKRVDIRCSRLTNSEIEFSVRDFGPGIAKDQMKKIFNLFYRTENELSRETVGTGIGLALVQQLVSKMNGRVDVLNRQPGTEFKMVFRI